MKLTLLVAFFVFTIGVSAQETIPPGTVIPARLNSTLSAKSRPGEKISARVMQNVPLFGDSKIPAGSRLDGHVVSVAAGPGGHGTSITFVMDKLIVRHRLIPVLCDLRALASPLEIDDAQIPAMGPDRGTPPSAYTTVQVGGDEVVYRGGGHVMNTSEVVGEPVPGGILGRAQPYATCRGSMDGNDQPQAFWVFSTDACGVYGFPGLTIDHLGRNDPKGKIILSTKGNLKIYGGSALLVRVMASGKVGT